jgi:hypothetical protein
MEGLISDILRNSDYRCSLNVLDAVQRVTLIDDKIAKIFEPSEEAPAVRLVFRDLPSGKYVHAEPMQEGTYSHGGSFIYSSDSRFRRLNPYPIPLHDRDMSKENR